MARTLSGIEHLKELLSGVRERAEHHANGVSEVIFPLIGAIVWKATEIRAREYGDHLANETRFTTESGQEYTVSYDHGSDSVHIKKGGMNGTVIFKADNHTKTSQISDFFESLV